MGNIDGLKEQVEELKHRLNSSGTQNQSELGEIKTRLATIKSSLEGKQAEIDSLMAEKEQLSAENDQLRSMLKEVLAVIGAQPAAGPTDVLQEFFAATDPLINPGKSPASGQRGENRPGFHPAASPNGAVTEDSGSKKTAQEEPGPDDGEGDVEESPALRRIMRRGNRAG